MTVKGHWHTGEISTGGFHQFYRDWRPAEPAGLPVLALHGSLTQSGSWIALAEHAGSIRLICPDQRGFGHSEDAGDDSCAAFAADAIRLAQQLLSGPFIVMGHSFACSIALEVARTGSAKVQGAVLVDPVIPQIAATAAPAIDHAERFATLDQAMQHFRDTEEGQWPGNTLARFTRDIMIPEGDGWRLPYSLDRLRRLRAFTASPASDFKLLATAKDVNCPVLAFRGGASHRFPRDAEARFTAAFLAPPALIVCPLSGHFPASSETSIVAGALTRFCTERTLS